MRGNLQNPPTSVEPLISSDDMGLQESSIPTTSANIRLNPLICGLPSGLRKDGAEDLQLQAELAELISVWDRLPGALRQSWLLTARALVKPIELA